MRQPTLRLTEVQLAFFRREGYLAVEGVTTPGEAAFVGRVIARLIATSRTFPNSVGVAQTPLIQVVMPVLEAPELVGTLLRANATAVARQLLGEATTFAGEQALIKPARHDVPTPWHQDEAYWDSSWDHTALAVWVALQDTDEENGCLRFLPRSHEWGVLPHHLVEVATGDIELEVDEIDAAGAVACPLPVGGATVHWSRTLHSAGANRTGRPRFAYSLGFHLPPRTRDRPFFSAFDR
jgi:ectoine hydroxylase-related dioxygenase (phytanoyl-CoA dioxygenase family)